VKKIIESAWENKKLLENEETKLAVKSVIESLDKGEIRVAEPTNNGWVVNEWIKKAVILYFPIQKMKTVEIGPFEFHDKIPLKNNYAKKGYKGGTTCNC
jgi:2,3,4,5-tetrahydropyridine-2-carboxylate N-succinyltransferase